VLRAGPLEEVLGEEQHVPTPFPQRRERERDAGEPVVEVFAKLSLMRRRRQVRVAGGQHPHIHGLGSSGTNPPHDTILDRREELGLVVLSERADLVEEERAVVGGLEKTRLGFSGIRVSALRVAKELGLHQVVRNGRAVELDERTACPRARSMEKQGQQSLARPRLALDQDPWEPPAAGLPLEQALGLLTDLHDPGALSDQLSEGVHGAGILRFSHLDLNRGVLPRFQFSGGREGTCDLTASG